MKKQLKIRDGLSGHLSGRVCIRDEESGEVLFSGENQITDFGRVALLQALLARDLERMVWHIVMGKGGDCDVLSPHPDTGARVPPDSMETEIREIVESIPIQAVAWNVDGSVTYKALARRTQGNSPDINELALYTRKNDMVAHFVTEEAVPPPRARRYVKNELSYWIIEWTVLYTGV
jgi:hypothetical protein